MRARVYAKPSGERVSLHVEAASEGPSCKVVLKMDEAERLSNELKDAVKEVRQWIG